jgi:hypothetical protein
MIGFSKIGVRLSLLSLVFIATSMAQSAPALAQAAKKAAEPTTQRAVILNTVRPRAERDLGPPVEFVVSTLNQRGDLAFVNLKAQRPGGRAVDLARTPIGRNGMAEAMDGPSIQAFLKRRNGTWQVEHYEIGATDVWYQNSRICAVYRTVLAPEVCRNLPSPK